MGDSFGNVAIDSTNRIVAVGGMSDYLVPGDSSTAQSQVVLARYNVNGNPDTSFGLDGSGRVWAPLGPNGKDVARAVAVHDGRIVVARYNSSERVGKLWRFNPDGAEIDTTFGDRGWVTDAVASGVSLNWLGMVLQADSRIVSPGCSPRRGPHGSATSPSRATGSRAGQESGGPGLKAEGSGIADPLPAASGQLAA